MTATVTATVNFWFEFASTYSYLSAARIQDICAKAGVALRWRSFLLGPVFAEQGLSASPFTVYPVKGAYMWKDMARCCADQGLPFRKPTEFPRGSLLAARIAASHADAPWLGPFVRSVFHANFALDRAIGDPAVIDALLRDIGQDPAPIVARATSDAGKADLRANTDQALAAGLFGAPGFVVRDTLFWGNDRMDQAIRHAQSA
jgi:2-hydroxychromene-2-carboxylate isomerase